jgi:hypothetical protein
MRSTQCAVQAVNNMAFSVEKCVCSWWSVTSKQNRLKQPRVITATNLDIQHQQNYMIWKCVEQFRQTENVNILKRVRRSTVVRETRVAEVSLRLNASLHKSLRKLAQETRMLYSSCRRAVKTLQLLTYKVHIIQQLVPLGCEKRHHFCEWFLAKVADDPRMLDVTLFSDEARLHRTGYVNSQNTRIWSAENLHATHKSPLYPIKIGVWCAVSHRRTFGPISFFEFTT